MKTTPNLITTGATLLMLAAGLMFTTGCESVNDPQPDASTTQAPARESSSGGFSLGPIDDFFKGGPWANPSDATTGVWSSKPQSVSVYPGSRYVTQDGKQFLETAIELRDDMGDSVKAPGKVRFELYQAGTGEALGPHLYTWDIDMLTAAEQSTHYSRVIRAYTFRLGLDNFDVQRNPTVLLVRFDMVDGQRFSTRERIGNAE